jgi:ribonuclease HI
MPERMTPTYSPTKGEPAWNRPDFVYTDGSKKGGPSPLGAAATHSASDTRIKVLVISTPPSHTNNRAKLAGIDIGLQLRHIHLLKDSACSLRLIQGSMNCPSTYRHNIHRDTLLSITHTLKTRCDSRIRTHLDKIKSHYHSLGNDLADTLANQVADGHPPDATYTTGSYVSIGHWTWPYTLIPQTLGEPMPYRYTNLKTDAHTYTTKHTHTTLSQTSKHGALLARAAKDGADFTFHKKHTTLTNIQFTHKQEFMWGVC